MTPKSKSAAIPTPGDGVMLGGWFCSPPCSRAPRKDEHCLKDGKVAFKGAAPPFPFLSWFLRCRDCCWRSKPPGWLIQTSRKQPKERCSDSPAEWLLEPVTWKSEGITTSFTLSYLERVYWLCEAECPSLPPGLSLSFLLFFFFFLWTSKKLQRR